MTLVGRVVFGSAGVGLAHSEVALALDALVSQDGSATGRHSTTGTV